MIAPVDSWTGTRAVANGIRATVAREIEE